MSIPLNIDWQQILLHLLNFVILAFGLYLLLYKPVKDFMDKRTEYYSRLDKQAQEKLASAAALEKSRQEHLSEIEAEISRKKEDMKKEAEAYSSAEIQKAKTQAEKIISDARSTANAEKERIVSSAGKEIAELAASAAEKLIRESAQHE